MLENVTFMCNTSSMLCAVAAAVLPATVARETPGLMPTLKLAKLNLHVCMQITSIAVDTRMTLQKKFLGLDDPSDGAQACISAVLRSRIGFTCQEVL